MKNGNSTVENNGGSDGQYVEKPNDLNGIVGWIRGKCRGPSMSRFYEDRILEFGEELEKKLIVDGNKTFLYERPGPLRQPKLKHQEQTVKLFEFLAKKRKEKWSKEEKGKQEIAQQHALTELSSLRAEIVDLKTQITNSERMMAAWIIGCILVYSKDIIPSPLILFVPVTLALFGFFRFREYQRNVFDLDCYLRELELIVRPDAGWVTYFFRTRRMESFFETRAIFWYSALFASTVVLLLALFGKIEPRPISVEVKPYDPPASLEKREHDIQNTPAPALESSSPVSEHDKPVSPIHGR